MPIQNQIIASLSAYFSILIVMNKSGKIEKEELLTCCFFCVLANVILYIDDIIYYIRKKINEQDKLKQKKIKPNKYLHTVELMLITTLGLALLLAYKEKLIVDTINFNPRPLFWYAIIIYAAAYGFHLLLDFISYPGISLSLISGQELYKLKPALKRKTASMYVFTSILIITFIITITQMKELIVT